MCRYSEILGGFRSVGKNALWVNANGQDQIEGPLTHIKPNVVDC